MRIDRTAIVMRGVPASGKSTAVEEFLSTLGDEARNWVVISVDSILQDLVKKGRMSFKSYPEAFLYYKDRIVKEQNTLFSRATKQGYNLILDSTNLSNIKCDLVMKNLPERYDIEWQDYGTEPHNLSRIMSLGKGTVPKAISPELMSLMGAIVSVDLPPDEFAEVFIAEPIGVVFKSHSGIYIID